MAYGVVDTIMTGHSSSGDLAALGLGAAVYGSLFLTLSGVVSALHPIIAQHYGGQREAAVGASYVQGLWLCLPLSVVGFPILAFPGLWMAYINPAPDVAELVGRYLRILSFALPGALAFRAIGALSTAVSRPRVVMLLTSLLLLSLYLRLLKRLRMAASRAAPVRAPSVSIDSTFVS
jgi:MATE family multidrug resistance protein